MNPTCKRCGREVSTSHQETHFSPLLGEYMTTYVPHQPSCMNCGYLQISDVDYHDKLTPISAEEGKLVEQRVRQEAPWLFEYENR